MLATLGLRALLVPVDDRLVRNTICIVQDLDDLRECLHNAGIFVALDLDGVDKSHLCFAIVTEWFYKWSVFL